MGTTERDIESQSTIPFDGREALHTVLRAKLDGVPMHYDVFVMKKDGCVYDLVYVAPPCQFAAGARDFERFALNLHAGSCDLPSTTGSIPRRRRHPAMSSTAPESVPPASGRISSSATTRRPRLGRASGCIARDASWNTWVRLER